MIEAQRARIVKNITENTYLKSYNIEVRGRALLYRHCGERMRVLRTNVGTSLEDKEYYCEQCHKLEDSFLTALLRADGP